MKISIGFLRGFFRRDSTTTLPPRVPGNPSMNFPSQGKNLLFRIGRFAYQPRAFTFPLNLATRFNADSRKLGDLGTVRSSLHLSLRLSRCAYETIEGSMVTKGNFVTPTCRRYQKRKREKKEREKKKISKNKNLTPFLS